MNVILLIWPSQKWPIWFSRFGTWTPTRRNGTQQEFCYFPLNVELYLDKKKWLLQAFNLVILIRLLGHTRPVLNWNDEVWNWAIQLNSDWKILVEN